MRRWLLPALIAPLLLLGAGCLGGGSDVELKPVTLEYWRYGDDAEVFRPSIEAYQKLHPNVDVKITVFREQDYEEKLLAAIAEERGPDIFSIPNVWLAAWRTKLLDLPAETVIPTRVVNPQKQVVTVNQKNASLTIRQLIADFVEAVPNDVIMLNQPKSPQERPKDVIYGLPLSLDTLAMFYNADLLRKADIEKPPETWRDLVDQVKRITVRDKDGNIEVAGATIGVARNVRHSTDLLSALMMQNGADMADATGYPAFAKYTAKTRDNVYPPGIEALIFYQGFGLKNSSNYTWDNSLPDSLDAFVAGKAGFTFGYPDDVAAVKERAPRLDFEVMPLPQVDPTAKANIAHYPVEVVSKKTANPNEAWDFIQFITSEDQVKSFLDATGKPTARRALISGQLTDLRAAPFAQQLLTARSWYKGKNWSAVVAAFDEMIETYPTAERPEYYPIIGWAVSKVTDTMR